MFKSFTLIECVVGGGVGLYIGGSIGIDASYFVDVYSGNVVVKLHVVVLLI